MIMAATTTAPTNQSPSNNDIMNRRSRSNSMNSPAESVIDAYASRILRINSPAEACIDPALGPYVTSIIRCALLNDPANKLELDDIEEVDSLLELLEEHCIMDRESAKNALLNIYITVKTGVVDDIFGSRNSSMRRRRGMSAGNEEEAIRLLGQMLRESDITNTVKDHQTFALGEGVKTNHSQSSESDMGFMFELDDLLGDDSLTCNAEDMKPDLFNSNQSTLNTSQDVQNLLPVTPLKPTTLIPADLLGVLDNPATPATNNLHSEPKKEIIDSANMETPRVQNTEKKTEELQSSRIELSEQTVPLKQNFQNHTPSKASLAQDLAATLFKPTRSRSNSILSEKRSPKYRPLQAPSTVCQTIGNFNLNCTNNNQLLESSVEILFSLNSYLSEEAAFEAARVSDNDVNVAQYILERAIAAPPICRHMLNNACYRSDCQFSHDVEGHTCKFWLKGRCGKGDTCRFLHGFSEQLLEGMVKPISNGQTANSNLTKPLNIPITTTNLVQHNMSSCSPQPFSFLSSSLDSKNSFNAAEAFGGGAFSLPLPQSLMPPPTPISTPIQSSFPTATMQNRYNSMVESKYNYENSNLSEKNTDDKLEKEDNFPSIQHEKYSLAQKSKNSKSSSCENSKASNDKSNNQKTFSFAKVASKGYKKELSFSASKDLNNINKSGPLLSNNTSAPSITNSTNKTVKYAKIPQELLNVHYGRNSTFFQISDPLERYYEVSHSSNNHHQRKDVIDLRFQSMKTFPVVLSRVLSEKLMQNNDVWIITVSGSNANRNFYQKSGSVLETAVLRWLSGKGYEYMKGRDKNGFGGAILVKGRR